MWWSTTLNHVLVMDRVESGSPRWRKEEEKKFNKEERVFLVALLSHNSLYISFKGKLKKKYNV